ncbi:hypothetical protein BCPG3_185 [Bacillus phage BCPG3]|uniref:Uncharacterized protein n=1 Tax=Bacillus phage SalinJah TaxID=1837830 RepID=A0A173GBC5_9CAUD|nr:hypothetical protein [Bacillus thuringiensis]YP_009282094.1 hypothetical protein SALINJAH_140 [Bacillus phage SalinJah]QQO38800.1 hypothetical protein BCPG1_068 [Bacillus phage BCPG1]QSJ04502.1 hypothetical protein BCPG3_185 [Bacillus phage BCPG3]QSJ04711.1 hypothetical protein BCP18_179 [Bacillus phage BCP18]ANH50607.1 hypothetical protein SALINJAH_140 [Bacillus phage SalinJah]OTZ47816.1 hypothetical protein BK762_19200 [Bacillus thuringiensis serovar toumanoffi]
MAEHKFTEEELERVMKVVVGDKAGRFPMDEEAQMQAIIHDVLNKQSTYEAADTLTKAEEVVRRLRVALLEKKLANRAREVADKAIESVNTLFPTESRHYRVDTVRPAGGRSVNVKIYKHHHLISEYNTYLEVK